MLLDAQPGFGVQPRYEAPGDRGGLNKHQTQWSTSG